MKSLRSSEGQSLVEFAMVFPIFALLLFGIVDLGRFVYTANSLNNGAREGARFATVGFRPTECTGLTREACAVLIAESRSWGVTSDAIDVTVGCRRIEPAGTTTSVAVADCRTNDLLDVTTSTEFTLITPIIAQFVSDPTITGSASMAVNQ